MRSDHNRKMHSVGIPEKDWVQAKIVSEDPQEFVREAVRTSLSELHKHKSVSVSTIRPLDLSKWTPRDWCDCMIENGYFGQNAGPEWEPVYYKTITGINKFTKKPVQNPYHTRSKAEVKGDGHWWAVHSKFVEFMAALGREIR